MSQASVRSVPRLLTDDERMKRIEASRGFLMWAQRDRHFLGRVTTDDTWLHYFEPEGKRESSVWKLLEPHLLRRRKCKVNGKIMNIMFMNRHGMLLKHVVQTGLTVISAYLFIYLFQETKQAHFIFVTLCIFSLLFW